VTQLLFLDFDGVLHPTSSTSAGLFCRADSLLQALEGSDCAVVISSSWRHHHAMQSLRIMLPTRLSARVHGATGKPHIGRWPRYHEITAYVRENAPAADWRALDDSVMEFPPNCPELIACHPNHGFQAQQAQLLVDWLASRRILNRGDEAAGPDLHASGQFRT
jgi:hypothetical protein